MVHECYDAALQSKDGARDIARRPASISQLLVEAEDVMTDLLNLALKQAESHRSLQQVVHPNGGRATYFNVDRP